METTITTPTARSLRALPDVTGLGGAVAGGLAGTVTLAMSPLFTWLNGTDMWEPLRVIAATVLGPDALAQSGFAWLPVLVGTLLYFAGAVLLGAIFGTLYRRVLHLTTEFGLPVYVGLVYGLMTCLIASSILLPASSAMRYMSTATITPLLVQQIVFAMCLGIFYTIVRPAPYQDTFEASW